MNNNIVLILLLPITAYYGQILVQYYVWIEQLK